MATRWCLTCAHDGHGWLVRWGPLGLHWYAGADHAGLWLFWDRLDA